MKNLLAFLLISIMSMFICKSSATEEYVQKNDASISKVEISVSPARIIGDIELTKSLIELRKTDIDKTAKLYANLELTSTAILNYVQAKTTVLDILKENKYLPRDRIEQSIISKSKIYRNFYIFSSSGLLAYIFFLLINHGNGNKYFWFLHLGLLNILVLLGYYIFPILLNSLLNPDYEYVKELIRLSG